MYHLWHAPLITQFYLRQILDFYYVVVSDFIVVNAF